MSNSGHAIFNPLHRRLEVLRNGESTIRYISCHNIPTDAKVFGVTVDGDEIFLMVGNSTSARPSYKIIYRFSSLSGGNSISL